MKTNKPRDILRKHEEEYLLGAMLGFHIADLCDVDDPHKFNLFDTAIATALFEESKKYTEFLYPIQRLLKAYCTLQLPGMLENFHLIYNSILKTYKPKEVNGFWYGDADGEAFIPGEKAIWTPNFGYGSNIKCLAITSQNRSWLLIYRNLDFIGEEQLEICQYFEKREKDSCSYLKSTEAKATVLVKRYTDAVPGTQFIHRPSLKYLMDKDWTRHKVEFFNRTLLTTDIFGISEIYVQEAINVDLCHFYLGVLVTQLNEFGNDLSKPEAQRHLGFYNE